jgi:hypothetical protein
MDHHFQAKVSRSLPKKCSWSKCDPNAVAMVSVCPVLYAGNDFANQALECTANEHSRVQQAGIGVRCKQAHGSLHTGRFTAYGAVPSLLGMR